MDDALGDNTSLPARRAFYHRLLKFIDSKGGIKHSGDLFILTTIREYASPMRNI